jgi:purine-binding chemotaxis protein CheW
MKSPGCGAAGAFGARGRWRAQAAFQARPAFERRPCRPDRTTPAMPVASGAAAERPRAVVAALRPGDAFGRYGAVALFYSAIKTLPRSAILRNYAATEPCMGASDLALSADIDPRATRSAPIVKGEYLTFRLGADEYGIDMLKVQEIRGYDTVTRVADAPAYILGAIDLRGTIVPIVDLRLTLGLGKARYDAFTVVIVLNAGERVLGAVVDSVSDVLELAPERIRAAPADDALPAASCIMGLASVRCGGSERMLTLLDIERLVRSYEPALAVLLRR